MDLNHHEVAPASPSSWCVYQFRHHRKCECIWMHYKIYSLSEFFTTVTVSRQSTCLKLSNIGLNQLPQALREIKQKMLFLRLNRNLRNSGWLVLRRCAWSRNFRHRLRLNWRLFSN